MTKDRSVDRHNYRILTFLISQILLGCGLGLSQPPVRDFQIWSETTFVKPLKKEIDQKDKEVTKVAFLFFGTIRLGQNRLYPVDRRVGVGIDLRLNENFSFTPTYVYRGGEPGRGKDEFEHRVRFDLTYSKKWKTVAIKNRDRVEFRIRHSRPDTVRFRNRFTFIVPVRQDGKEMFAPFVSTEPYFDFREKKWTSHEFNAGIARKLSENVSAEFFYIHRNNKGNTLKHINAFAGNFKIVL